MTEINGYLFDDSLNFKQQPTLAEVLWKSSDYFLGKFVGIRDPIIVCKCLGKYAVVLHPTYRTYRFIET